MLCKEWNLRNNKFFGIWQFNDKSSERLSLWLDSLLYLYTEYPFIYSRKYSLYVQFIAEHARIYTCSVHMFAPFVYGFSKESNKRNGINLARGMLCLILLYILNNIFINALWDGRWLLLKMNGMVLLQLLIVPIQFSGIFQMNYSMQMHV